MAELALSLITVLEVYILAVVDGRLGALPVVTSQYSVVHRCEIIKERRT